MSASYEFDTKGTLRSGVLYPIVSLQSNQAAMWNGEVRPPKKGEYFFSGAVIEAYQAPNDLSTEFAIARIVEIEPAEYRIRHVETPNGGILNCTRGTDYTVEVTLKRGELPIVFTNRYNGRNVAERDYAHVAGCDGHVHVRLIEHSPDASKIIKSAEVAE